MLTTQKLPGATSGMATESAENREVEAKWSITHSPTTINLVPRND